MIKRHPPDMRLIALSDEGPGSVHRAAVIDASIIYRIAADGACAEPSPLFARNVVQAPPRLTLRAATSCQH